MDTQLKLSKRVLSTLVVLFILFSNLGYSQHDSVTPCVENPPNHDIPNNPPEIDPCTFEYVYLNVDNISELGANVNQKLNENIYIYKDLNIDKDFTFKDCTVKIAPDVKITITSSKKFRIDHSHLFTCYLLWEGIQVSNLSKLEILNQSEISDAKKAINRLGNSAQFWLNNSTYSNNKYCIYLSVPPTSADNKFEFLEFKGNQFVCNRYLKGTTNEITEAGIYLENYTFHNLSFNLTPSTLLANKFVSLNYGIQQKGKLKKLNLKNFYFVDIKVSGIYLENALLTCSLLNFQNCKFGIQILNAALADIKYSIFQFSGEFNSRPTGISINNLLTNANVRIERNKITQESACNQRVDGILIGYKEGFPTLYKCSDKALIEVIYNDFFAFSELKNPIPDRHWGLSGIIIGYSTMPTSSNVGIDFNNFYLANNCNAITSFGVRYNFFITQNLVQSSSMGHNLLYSKLFNFWANSFSYGGPGIETYILDNKILSLYPDPETIYPAWFNQGLTLNAYTNALICDNYFEHNYQDGAFVFDYDCSNTKFSQNIGLDGKFLNLKTRCQIGEQYLRGNQQFKDTPFTGIASWSPNVDCDYAEYAKLSKFTVTQPRSTSTVIYPKHPLSIEPEPSPLNDVWWTYDTFGIDIDCPVSLSIQEDRFRNSNTELIVTGAIQNPVNGSLVYQLNTNLYNQVLAFPSSFQSYSPLNSWMNNIINNTLIDEYSSLIGQALNISKSDINSNVRAFAANYLQNLGLILMNDTLLNSIELDSIYQLSDSLINLYNYFNDIQQIGETQKAQNLIQQFSLIPASNNYEQVVKDYFNIYLSLYIGESFTQSMLNKLIEISNLCPSEYSVYPVWANMLIPKCYRSIDLDSDYNCNQTSQFLQGNKEIHRTFLSDEFLYNLYGQRIIKFNILTDKLNQINIPPGVYLYISSNGHFKKIVKY